MRFSPPSIQGIKTKFSGPFCLPLTFLFVFGLSFTADARPSDRKPRRQVTVREEVKPIEEMKPAEEIQLEEQVPSREETKTIEDTHADVKYNGQPLSLFDTSAPTPSPSGDTMVDSWFQTGFNFSLDKLSLILPSFIQVTPESRLIGDVRWNLEGFSQVSIHADGIINSIRINHPGLADGSVNIPDLAIKGTIIWNRSDMTLSFQDLTVGRAGVMVRLSGRVSYQNETAVQLNMSLPTTPIQQVLDALPYEMIPKIKGAVVQGSIALETKLAIDPQQPEATLFEPGIMVTDYALISEPPALGIQALKSDFIYDARKNGTVVRSIVVSKANPRFVPIDQLGKDVRQAILRAEDAAFFQHAGFDLQEIRKALVQNLNAKKYARGGSTITQQLAKNLFLNGQKNLSRKLQEALLAYALERELSKERILEIYTNVIEWGLDVYGLSEAASHYFSKNPSSLTPSEAAFLASIIPNPIKKTNSAYSNLKSDPFIPAENTPKPVNVITPPDPWVSQSP